MAQEHQEYIQNKVNPILENLVTQVLLKRPDNPVPFMVKWLASQSTQKLPALTGVGEAEKLREEIRVLQTEVRELEARLNEGGASKGSAAPQEEKEDSEEEEEEDDVDDADVIPHPAAYLQGRQRTSVSAEAYGQWNKMAAFTPPVHPKTEEQKQRLLKVLQSSFLFNSLGQEDMDIVVGAMVERRIESNERIIQEGDSGDVMFVIEHGSFNCLKKIAGEEKVVKQCDAGDFFGELALLYNCPRAASVEARESSLLWALDRETFNHIVRDASVKRHEEHEEFLKSVPLLSTLGNYERMQLADSFQKMVVVANTVVIKQGDEGDKFFFVEDGELLAQRSLGSGEPPKELSYKKGDYFGELALLNKQARAATVIAKTDASLLWVDSRLFKRCLGPLEDVMRKNATKYQ